MTNRHSKKKQRPEDVVNLAHLEFLTPPDEAENAVDVEQLNEYAESLGVAIGSVVGELAVSPGCDLAAQFELIASEGPKVTLDFADGRFRDWAVRLSSAFEAVRAPEVTGDVRLRFYFQLWGGSGQPCPWACRLD